MLSPPSATPQPLPDNFPPVTRQSAGTIGNSWVVRVVDDNFYLFMSLLIAAVVVYGFGRTVERRLLHPAISPPRILYVHAAVFSGWVFFFIAQAALVRIRQVRWHRRMGYFGAALGIAVTVLGIWTSITMGRFNLLRLHHDDAPLTLLRSFYDISAFAILFALAIALRTKPELHRRLMLVAVCALTDPAFSRFPSLPIDLGVYQDYLCVDLLVLLGVARGLVINHRTDRIYLVALVCLVVSQTAVVHAIRTSSPHWVRVAHGILG